MISLFTTYRKSVASYDGTLDTTKNHKWNKYGADLIFTKSIQSQLKTDETMCTNVDSYLVLKHHR